MSRESILAQERRTAERVRNSFDQIAGVFEEKAKETRTKTELLRETINGTEVYWNDKVSDLGSTVKDTDTVIDDQIHKVINTNIQGAADAQIGLVNEIDPKKRRILQRGTINSWWELYYGIDVNDFVAEKVKLDSKYKWVQRPIRSNPTKSERDMMAHCTYYGRNGYHYKEQSSPH